MSSKFEIAGVEYDVVKKGMPQAKQVAGLSRWLAAYGTNAFRKLSEGNFEKMGGLEIAISVLGSLDEDALIDLFQFVFGCPRQVAEEEFELMLMVDGLVALYNQSPTVKKIADRFFSVASSESTEDPSSTPSEPPTAG